VPVRRLPVRPDLAALESEAREMLQAYRAGDPAARAGFAEHHPAPPDARSATEADARLVLARAYQATDWDRLATAARLADAIWRDDLEAVRALVEAGPHLLREEVLIRRDSNWGPPMTYAANLGRDAIIRMLRAHGATDFHSAAGRAALQGHVGTARMLYEWAGSPPLDADALGGPAYTLNVAGTALLLELGAPVVGPKGERLAPVDVVLQTDARDPEAKHAILALYERHGLRYPDTPPMALHRGRTDLLEAHLRRDPALLARTFRHREIYPAEMRCGDPLDATTGTPLDGTTLLHMCVEFGELELARWLLARGADPNARAHVGPSGFGGWTPLFHAVVSQPNFWMNYRERGPFEAPFAELLLAHGADPNARGSIWKRLHPGHGDPARHDYRDVTPLGYGRRFHAPVFVSAPAMGLIEAAGGAP
jgi:ankyrin repeat protein